MLLFQRRLAPISNDLSNGFSHSRHQQYLKEKSLRGSVILNTRVSLVYIDPSGLFP